MVRSWQLDAKGQVVPPPEYTVKVLGPAAKEAEPRPILKTVLFRPTPNAVRAKLDDETPTLEVKLK